MAQLLTRMLWNSNWLNIISHRDVMNWLCLHKYWDRLAIGFDEGVGVGWWESLKACLRDRAELAKFLNRFISCSQVVFPFPEVQISPIYLLRDLQGNGQVTGRFILTGCCSETMYTSSCLTTIIDPIIM